VTDDSPNWKKSLVLGIIASAAIPLFLHIVDSNLMLEAKIDFTNYFVFAGFCLIAAVFSTRFLDSLSSSIINRLQQVETRQTQQEELVMPIVENNQAPLNTDPGAQAGSENADIGSKGLFMDSHVDAASAMSSKQFLYFSEDSLAKMTNKSTAEIADELKKLEAQGKAKQITKGSTGEKVWVWKG
jgi:type II secretory pathway pseudopilin PulG